MTLEYWKTAVIQSLEELSDPEFQKKAWLRNEGNLISSPSEASDELFNDTGLGEEMKSRLVFSDIADSLLKELRKRISKINFEQNIETMLSSKEWIDIRELALQTLLEVKKAVNTEKP